MNIEQEIRVQIEKNKGLKLAVGEINSHLSVLEGLLRNERDDAQKRVDEAYQRGLDDGKKVNEEGCVGCEYADKVVTGPPCITCCNSYRNQWTAKKQDDKIEVGDEVDWDGDRFIVTRIYKLFGDKNHCDGIGKNGCVYNDALVESLVKTGRTFPLVASIVEEMTK